MPAERYAAKDLGSGSRAPGGDPSASTPQDDGADERRRCIAKVRVRDGQAMNNLVLNAGSSTLKFRLLSLRGSADDQPHVLVDGLIDKWGTPQAGLKLSIAGEKPTREAVAAESSADAAEHAIRVCQPRGIDALGHRVVHGGP